MINSHLLELPLSRTYFHSSKGVRVIEVLLYTDGLLEDYYSGPVITHYQKSLLTDSSHWRDRNLADSE